MRCRGITSPRFEMDSMTGFRNMRSKLSLLLSFIPIATHIYSCAGRLYYQYNPRRVALCPLTIHALLHIADFIEAIGPVWACWAFPMERFCGKLLTKIRNRRFPWSNIDAYLLGAAQLSQIKLRFNLEDELRLRPKKGDLTTAHFSHPDCESAFVLTD